jgi:hypothetical protein
MSDGEQEYLYEECTEEGRSEGEHEEREREWNDLDLHEKKNYSAKCVTRSTKGQYKKEAHLREVINQRRGGGGSIPNFVLDKVIQKRKVYHQLKLEKEKNVLFLLKEAGERTSYEHAPQLAWILAKQQPKFLQHHEYEEAIHALFVEAKRAWEKAPSEVKGKRKSFPPYKDWLRRCCLMLGLIEDANSLRGLKHPPKIREVNKIWAYFGTTCGWKNWENGIVCEYE